MKTIKKPKDILLFSKKMHLAGKTIGLVPTMGCLHEGHLSLVREAKKRSGIVIVSIFVNPTQFGPNEDYNHYPKTLKKDKALLNKLNIDLLFTPSVKDMYPEGFSSFIKVEGVSGKLCGHSRPGHFRGVTTIVAKLFNIVSPDYAFFGEKDYQQQLIIKKMVKDLNLPVKIISQPTIRESDGTAKSSRNKYLSAKQREAAPVLYQSLLLGKELAKKKEKNVRKILAKLRAFINKERLVKLDYLSIVDPKTLQELKTVKNSGLIILAAYLGKTRLIDNILIKSR
jgi:pantoate--beta-alanine ligase